MDIIRGLCGLVGHAVYINNHSNYSTKKHITDKNSNLYPFSWVLITHRILFTYIKTPLRNTPYPVLTLTVLQMEISCSQILTTSEIFPGNPAYVAFF